jgi:hypothetical protein
VMKQTVTILYVAKMRVIGGVTKPRATDEK